MVIVFGSIAITKIRDAITVGGAGSEGTSFLTVNHVMEKAMQHASQPHQTHGKEKTHENQTSLQ
jgi:hypothetical protein